MRMSLPIVLLALASLLSACNNADDFAKVEPGEPLSSGATTVHRNDKDAFSMPAANLSPLRRMDFFVGNAFFRGAWRPAIDAQGATTSGRSGLGPLFNTDSCQSCHIKDGRGAAPAENSTGPALSSLVRLSIPAGPTDKDLLKRLGVVPEPTYGGQLQDMAISGHAPEGRVSLSYTTVQVELAENEQVELRKPRFTIEDPGYGPFHPHTLMSLRVAPPMIGLGLLEAIGEEDLRDNVIRQMASGSPVNGHLNRVWDDALQTTVTGRFGWKAGQPNLNQQNAHAFAGDMGLTSTLIPSDDCTTHQPECRDAPSAGVPEVKDKVLASVLFYTQTLGVPARRSADSQGVLQGKALFHRSGCAECHRPSYVTGQHPVPELSGQRIFPYTDLLLHDMGEGLADGRPEFQASGREWRTPPLWGIGLTQAVSGHSQFLHDGRARTLLEAILWHDGEAAGSRKAVQAMSRVERKALLEFLQSL